MPIGTSIFLIAVGAIIRYGLTFHVSGVSRPTIGLILIIAGIVGVVLSLIYMATRSTPSSRRTLRRTAPLARSDPWTSAAAGRPVRRHHLLARRRSGRRAS